MGLRVNVDTPSGTTVRTAVADWPLKVAVIVVVELLVTVSVLAIKLPDVAPAAMVQVAGTVATEVLLDVRAIVNPPEGAGPPIVTVPVDVSAELTRVGLRVSPVIPAGVIVNVAGKDAAPSVAVIVGVSVAATALVVTVALAVVDPAGTVTVAGTEALASLELRLTTVPPVGAATLRVTVAVEEDPPRTEVGDRLRPVRATGVAVIVSDLVAELPLNVAVMVVVVLVATGLVTMEK